MNNPSKKAILKVERLLTDAEKKKVRGRAEVCLTQLPPALPNSFPGLELIGLELIEERARQISEEGYDAKHDDGHRNDEILAAAESYLQMARAQVRGANRTQIQHLLDVGRFPWPWDDDPVIDSPLRNLVKAGALIAAEIDRMHRATERDGVAR